MFRSKINFWLIVAVCLLSSVFFSTTLKAQQPLTAQNLQSFSLLFNSNQQIQKPQSLTSHNLVTSIDENEYEVDSGDEFYIRVDVEGPDVKVFKSTVSADGMLILPEVPAIYVRGLLLKEAKVRIKSHLKKYFKTDEIDVALSRIHTIKISVIGALEPVTDLNLTSADHLVNAIQKIAIAYQGDTTRVKMLSRVSLRRINLIRGQKKKSYDLLRFLREGDQSQNPLLKTNDILYVPYRDSLIGNITIGGQVGSPGIYEFIPGDNISTIIAIAGGMLTAADSNRIEIYRRYDPQGFRRVISFKQDSLYSLAPGDRVFVRAKINNRKQAFVKVEGEVKYPGKYPIVEGQTRLSDVIKWFGGFTDEADPKRAYVHRMLKTNPGEKETARIKEIKPQKLPTVDKSFLKEFYREKLENLQVDLTVVQKNPASKFDFLLKDGDLIFVPSRVLMVTIAGGVKEPGIYPYVEGATVKDYVAMAGGYTTRVKKSMIKIIKGKSGVWLDAKEKSVPEAGDQVFIPRRDELEFWPVLKEALSLFVQLGTVFVIIRSTR